MDAEKSRAEPAAPSRPSRPSPAAAVPEHVVAAAVWAPSIHNTQPWRFEATDGQIDLHADESRKLPVTDPDGREMVVSCGAALFTARLALRSLGYVPRARALPDPGRPMLLAQLTWPDRADATGFERAMFSQVTARRTHRGGFDPVPLSARLIGMLSEGAGHDGAGLLVLSEESRAFLAAVVQDADLALRSDSAYLRELARWTAEPDSARRDGVPSASYPPGSEPTYPYFPPRDFAHGHGWGEAGVSSAAPGRSAGLVCLLTTATDTPADWVSAGQALQRILLTSAASGVAVALHSQPIEVPRTRELIRARLSDGAFPQMILRLGTVIQNAASVRRPAGSVLGWREDSGPAGAPDPVPPSD